MRASEFIARRRMLLHPKCERCGASMWLTSIEPDKPDYDKRVFDCPECKNTVTQIVKYRGVKDLESGERDNPFAASNLFTACPKCGSEAQLMSAEKFPDRKGEIRIYGCGNCSHKNEVIVRA